MKDLLENADLDDVTDLLVEVEKSFNIKFEGDELMRIKNFGELCDHITNKIELENTNDCTSQQAFYKLRNAFSTELDIDKKEITIQSKLSELLPKQVRRSNLKKLEQKLGVKLKILSPSNWIIFSLLATLLLSIICFFFSWKLAVSGIGLSIFGFLIADLTDNKIDLETVGHLVEKMVRENYLKSRRDKGTFNRKEIEVILIEWFSDKLDLEKTELKRDAKFI